MAWFRQAPSRAGARRRRRPLPPGKRGRLRGRVALAATATLLLVGCAHPRGESAASAEIADSEDIQVVATTPILADMTEQIAGERAEVTSLVPPGADPHSYEPSLRDVRDIAYADLAVTNGMLLEQHSLLQTVTATLPEEAEYVPVAEKIEAHGGSLRPMTENLSLDTPWLGLRVQGAEDREQPVADQPPVSLSVTGISGPGHAAAFITGTFGRVQIIGDSEASPEDTDGDGADDLGSMELPRNAHTHLTWAFTEPGEYEVRIAASTAPSSGPEAAPQRIGENVVRFVVGQDPHALAQRLGPDVRVLDGGHADITADLEDRQVTLWVDTEDGAEEWDPQNTVIAVPPKALQELPAGSQYRFLGHPTDQVYLLAQAVLGQHVHGEIDPHIWHSVPNAQAMVEVIRDALIRADPAATAEYTRRAEQYDQRLVQLDERLRQLYGSLPEDQRQLITTHDGYGYLAEEYELSVAGFVAPVPGTEPGPQQRRRLDQTIRDLNIPAVFIDRGPHPRAVLHEVAEQAGIQVCRLYSDTLDDAAPTYVQMMTANAEQITRCLG